MTFGGWLMMIVSLTSVIILTGYCLYKVLTAPEGEVSEIEGGRDMDFSEK